MKTTPRVIIESPYKWENYEGLQENLEYCRQCILDCLKRWEAPFASHILYTQVLDDRNPEDRYTWIEAWLEWGKSADYTVVYEDRGISQWMKYWIRKALEEWREVFYRTLYNNK